MNDLDSLLKQLHDIEGLDPIHAWPLAIGWWVLIGVSAIVAVIALVYLIRWVQFRRSWKYDSQAKLNALLNDLSNPSTTPAKVQEVAILLSEYLRRIALRRYSRKTCAKLTGDAWLQWLTKNDTKNFDWSAEGNPLVVAPYAPANHHFEVEQLKKLVYAAKEWVR